MPLTAGSRLGPYTISALLGSGGMGEVYRAFDERLGRDVAIKVLREEASADRDLQRRFALEARSASALNHPNILTVHDVGMERGIPYIVSELIDGESLRGLLERGPVPLRKTLDVAVQVAAGLAAAHQGGIVHRDLKPPNVMVTKDGFAKILDFGLAKPIAQQAAAAAGENTSPGVIAGTATYMSPEQVRGEPLDHRTDQFSFGLVLYELLTGKATFARSSAVTTMAAIVQEEAQPITELNPAVPAPLRWCIERCLAKEPNERYASTSDLQRELQTVRTHLDELSSPSQTLPDKPVRRRRIWVPVLLTLAGLLAGVVLAELFLVPDSAVDLAVYRVRPLATAAMRAGSPAWSADGKSIAFAAEVNGVQQLFVRDINLPTAGQITNSTADCRNPFWLPDGSKILYLSAGAAGTDLYAIGATGGAPERVQQNVAAASTSPDGRMLVFLRTDPEGKDPLSFWTASPPGGSARKIEIAPFTSGKYHAGYVAFAPNGKGVGVWLSRWDGGSEFWVLPWPSGAPQESFSFVAGTYPFSWMPDSRRIVFGGVTPGSLGADLQMVDTQSGRMRPLTMEVKNAVEASVSPDGRHIAFSASEDDFDIVSVPLDGSPMRTVLSTSRSEFDPAWSPAGDQLAVSTDRTGTSQIWIGSPREGSERPLVTEKDFGQTWAASFDDPAFSPDGRRLAYSILRTSGHSIYTSSVAGGKPVRLVAEESDQRAPSWNGDGAWIAYLRNRNGIWELVKAPSGGGSVSTLLARGVLSVSPQWNHATGVGIVCMTSDGLTLISEDGKDRQVLSNDHWLVFGWSRDGGLIAGIKQADGRRVVATLDVRTHAEKVIADLSLPSTALIRGFSLAPDGLSFATAANHPTGDLFILDGFAKPGLLPALR